jgi:hypothetical protein
MPRKHGGPKISVVNIKLPYRPLRPTLLHYIDAALNPKTMNGYYRMLKLWNTKMGAFLLNFLIFKYEKKVK